MAGLHKDHRILEIGPSHAPLAPKAGGWNSKALDHLSREDLVAKYRGHQEVDLDRIETVDFVWRGGTISDAVPVEQWGTFDVLLASHVAEHLPDLIGFFLSAEKLLRPDGRVVLALPDKRYCFDFFQPLSTTGQVLAAHAEGRSKHTPQLIFDYYAYAVASGSSIAFIPGDELDLRFIHPLAKAASSFEATSRGGDYLDVHAWRFTPTSLELILLELAAMGVLDWQLERATPNSFEFYAWLKTGAKQAAGALTDQELSDRRISLMKKCVLEFQEQVDSLRESASRE